MVALFLFIKWKSISLWVSFIFWGSVIWLGSLWNRKYPTLLNTPNLTSGIISLRQIEASFVRTHCLVKQPYLVRSPHLTFKAPCLEMQSHLMRKPPFLRTTFFVRWGKPIIWNLFIDWQLSLLNNQGSLTHICFLGIYKLFSGQTFLLIMRAILKIKARVIMSIKMYWRLSMILNQHLIIVCNWERNSEKK